MTSVLRKPSSAKELLEIAELTGIRTFEIRGQMLDREAPHGDLDVATPDVAIRVAETAIETRMRLQITTEAAELVADMSAEYTLSEPVRLTRQVVEEFVERVGVMAVYPFVRESIFSTASRLGIDAPILGLLHAGSFQIGILLTGADDAAVRHVTPAALAQELRVSAKTIRSRLRDQGCQPEPNGRWQLTEDQAEALRAAFA